MRSFLLAVLAVSVLTAGELPEGDGKKIIQQQCAGCHPGNALGGYQKTREDWENIVARMGQRTTATRDELTTLTDYLAANFPKVDDPSKVNMNKADAKEISERLGFERGRGRCHRQVPRPPRQLPCLGRSAGYLRRGWY